MGPYIAWDLPNGLLAPVRAVKPTYGRPVGDGRWSLDAHPPGSIVTCARATVGWKTTTPVSPKMHEPRNGQAMAWARHTSASASDNQKTGRGAIRQKTDRRPAVCVCMCSLSRPKGGVGKGIGGSANTCVVRSNRRWAWGKRACPPFPFFC